MKKLMVLLYMMLLQLSCLKAADSLKFSVRLIQGADTFNVSNNAINLHRGNIAFELKMPAYMMSKEGEKYSSVNYIATNSEDFFKAMKASRMFYYGRDFPAHTFDAFNTSKSLIVGESGYSYWLVSNNSDYNVSQFKLDKGEIRALIDVDKLFMEQKSKDIDLKKFKGTIYMMFEAVTPDATEVGARYYVILNFS